MLDPADIVFRTIAVMGAVLLALLLLSLGRQRAAALPGALFALALAAFFLTSTSAWSLGAWRTPLTALCVTKAAWYWLFSRALFREQASLKVEHLAVVGALAVAGTWQQLVFLAKFRAGSAETWETMLGFGVEGALLVLVTMGLLEAWRGLSIDLVERRRRVRLGFILASGAYLTATLLVQSYNLVLDVTTPTLVSRANMAAVAVGCLLAAWLLLRPRSESWLDPARQVHTVALTPNESAVLARLEQALEVDRVHLEEGLTVGGLAARLGAGEHVLRRVINQGLGFRNFNDFLHAWRIREACGELARPEQARMPVLSVAMKVGYGSIGAFNRAFKARVGMTPTAYRRTVARDGPEGLSMPAFELSARNLSGSGKTDRPLRR